MQYIHVVNGDVAGNTLRQALARGSPARSTSSIPRDDLAVGPLLDSGNRTTG
ncbi:DUF1835 domain-containing protein [Cupriavidus basilensis]